MLVAGGELRLVAAIERRRNGKPKIEGRIDAFVYGSGTGGTISGVGRFLTERNPEILVVAVEPRRSPVPNPNGS